MTGDYMSKNKAELVKEAKKRKLPIITSALKGEIVLELQKDDRRKTRVAAKKKSSAVKPAAKKKAAVSKPAVKKKSVPSKPAAKKKSSAVKPAAKKKAAVSKPAVRKKSVTAKPAAKKKSSAVKPAPEAKKKSSAVKPAAKKKAAVSKPAVKKKNVTAKPVAKKKSVTAKPVAKKKSSAVKPAEKEKATVSKPAEEDKSVTAKPVAKPAVGKAEEKTAVATGTSSSKPSVAIKGKRDWDIKIDGEKFYVAKEETDYIKPKKGDLPRRYNETRITALARDPFTIYIYWELTEEAIENARSIIGKSLSDLRLTLRTYKTGKEAGNDPVCVVTVDPASESAYVNVPEACAEYSVEIGFASDDGAFSVIARSNRVTTPSDEPSGVKDSEWPVSDEIFEEIYLLSGGGLPAGSSMGASELPHVQRKRKKGEGGVSSFGGASERKRK